MESLASVCLIAVLVIGVIQLVYSFYIGSFLIKVANELAETKAVVEELRYIQYVRNRRPPEDAGLVEIPPMPPPMSPN